MREHMLRWPRCAVWADMGLGKTSSALSVLDGLMLFDSAPALVVAPRRVALTVWPNEVEKFDNFRGMRVQTIIGTRAERLAALSSPRADLYTINYDNLPWLLDTCRHYKRWPFSKVIADESTRLKNFRLRGGGKRSAAMSKVAHTHIKHWVNLTGTPSPNGLIDLWGQTWFLDAGRRLGRTFTSFKERFFQLNYDGTISPHATARGQIEFLLKDICISIRSEDWFPVDKPIFTTIEVDLPETAMKQYLEMEKQMFSEIAGKEITALNSAALTTKCLQIANGAIYYEDAIDIKIEFSQRRRDKKWIEVHSAKLSALESLYYELSGAPLIVAYQFKHDLARIKSKFPEAATLDDNPAYHVNLEVNKYKSIEDAWNAGKIKMLVAHPASAGHGLNLQDGGHHIVFLGNWWNLEEYLQIIDRIGPVRQKQSGHERSVFVYTICARGTFDELVIARRNTKRETQDLLKEAMAKRGVKC
jgi:SNF2 family DNA or RNA helicase